MKAFLCILTFLLSATAAIKGQQGLSVGDDVPRFSAPADDGSMFDIKEFLGKNYIVLYFYPAAMTTGCTKQACAYRDHSDDLKAADVIVAGISGDKTENLRLFKKAENLNFRLLSDTRGDIARSFGVPVTEGGTIKRALDGLEHELERGVTAKRWTFIVGKDGKIIYKNDAVNAEKDTEEVLEFIRKRASE